MNCQMFSCEFSSGHLAGSGMSVMLDGMSNPPERCDPRRVCLLPPSGLIDEDGGVRSRRNLRGDLGQVQVHRLSVAPWHDKGRALAVLRADCAENVGRGGSLVAGGRCQSKFSRCSGCVSLGA